MMTHYERLIPVLWLQLVPAMLAEEEVGVFFFATKSAILPPMHASHS